MRTAIISDLHLGAGAGGDLLHREAFRAPLLAALESDDRVVLLGDLIELRDRPIDEAFAIAKPFLRDLTEAVPAGELIIVPGNHDHHLVEPWLERRLLEGEPPLGLEQRVEPEATPLATLVRELSEVSIEIAYPGIWLRDDVYATHGHYLDRHLTVPTFERLGVAAVERLLGVRPAGPDPLEPPVDTPEERSGQIDPVTYEHAQSPVYALLFALAQGAGGERGAGNPSMRIWNAVGAGDGATAKLRGWLLGSVAVPGAVSLANRLGLGPVRSDLTPGAITRAGLAAMREVIERLGIEAQHVIFGHTHRRGPLGSEQGWEGGPDATSCLWNTGSWLHSPTMLASTAARSPYWPGTVCFLGDEGEPELRHLLDDLNRDDFERGLSG